MLALQRNEKRMCRAERASGSALGYVSVMVDVRGVLGACFLVVACSAGSSVGAEPTRSYKKVSFASEDGLRVTADLYVAHAAKAPFIVLFHQAGWSRGEYREIAPRLNKLGFNCMAVDQRAGKGVNGVNNETAARARRSGKSTTYVDALPDMRAALRYVRKHYASGKVLAWGSSYSSALVLVVSAQNPQLVDGTLSFAPGEYFLRFGKSARWIRDSAAKIQKPAFITSARNERKNWSGIVAAIPHKVHRSQYLPSSKGQHGSRALWRKFSDSAGYWNAVIEFLASFRRSAPSQ